MKDVRSERWTDRERNNEIDGSREVMTAGCPHRLMDDKCSVAVSVRIPAHLCQYSTSQTDESGLSALINFVTDIFSRR